MRTANKQAIASAFGRAATTYETFADLQRISGEILMARLNGRKFDSVLDAGCGTGWYSKQWCLRAKRVIALDLSAAMLAQAQKQQTATSYLLGDIEALPLADKQVSLAWSNLALQWCTDLRQGIQELYRVTSAGGCVAFTTLEQGSLAELHTAWQALDCHPHVNTFLSFEDIAFACRGLSVSLKQHRETQYFPDVISVMRTIKGTGATHLQHGRRDFFITPSRLERLSRAWPCQSDYLPLTWHLVSGVIERD